MKRRRKRNPKESEAVKEALKRLRKTLYQDIDAVMYEHEDATRAAKGDGDALQDADETMLEEIGKLIRQYKKDAPDYSEEWDEKLDPWIRKYEDYV